MTNESTQLRALIVDDDEITRRMLTHALSREGFTCMDAHNGNAALQALRRVPCDLVVTDLRMPQKHGHALATELLEFASRPLIVVHTSLLAPRMTKDLLSRGVDDVVDKPTNYAAFAGKMRALISRRNDPAERRSPPEAPRPQPEQASDNPPAPNRSEPRAATQSESDRPLYRLADLPDASAQQRQFYDEAYSGELRRMAETVLAAEAPIRDDRLARRLTWAHGIGRTSARALRRIQAVLEDVTAQEEECGRFYWACELPPPHHALSVRRDEQRPARRRGDLNRRTAGTRRSQSKLPRFQGPGRRCGTTDRHRESHPIGTNAFGRGDRFVSERGRCKRLECHVHADLVRLLPPTRPLRA